MLFHLPPQPICTYEIVTNLQYECYVLVTKRLKMILQVRSSPESIPMGSFDTGMHPAIIYYKICYIFI